MLAIRFSFAMIAFFASLCSQPCLAAPEQATVAEEPLSLDFAAMSPDIDFS